MTSKDLKLWRKRLKLSQEKAASVLGCSRTSIRNWENGQQIPHYIGLACAAYAHGLPAIGETPL